MNDPISGILYTLAIFLLGVNFAFGIVLIGNKRKKRTRK